MPTRNKAIFEQNTKDPREQEPQSNLTNLKSTLVSEYFPGVLHSKKCRRIFWAYKETLGPSVKATIYDATGGVYTEIGERFDFLALEDK